MHQSQSFNMAWQYSNYLVQISKQRPSKLVKQMKCDMKWKALQQKLTELYLSECNTPSLNKDLFTGSHLLQKLVAKEKLNSLVVNLYPGNEGYSLMLKTRTGSDTETIRLPYEEGELLQYIDNEELPPLLVDLLERSQANVFYSGCVIVEVRDYRRSSNPSTCDYHHVLLKPTTQSLVCDVGLLTNDSQRWTWEDRHALESALLLATSEPLCLDPSISVALVANRLHYRKQFLARWPLKRMMKKHSQSTINKKRKFEHCAAPPNLKLYDFLAKRRNKTCSQPLVNLKVPKQVDVFKPDEVVLIPPEVVEVEKYAQVIERPKPVTDNNLVTVEEYIMEIERNPGKVLYTQVTVLQRPTDEQYFGRLLLGRDNQQNGTSCFFSLGSKTNAEKYIDQFTKIFTEEGRKAVKITHLVPGQLPKVTYTQGAKEMMENAASTSTVTTTASVTVSASSSTTTTTTTASTTAVSVTAPTTNTTSTITTTLASSTTDIAADFGDSSQTSCKKSSHPPKLLPCTTVSSSVASTVTMSSSSSPASSSLESTTQNSSVQNSSASIKRPRSPSPVLNSAPGQAAESPPASDSSVLPSRGPPGLSRLTNDAIASPSSIPSNANIAGLGLTQNIGLHNLVASSNTNVVAESSVPNSPEGVIPVTSPSLSTATILVSSGMITSSPSALSTPASMLTLPLNASGGISTQSVAAQLVASGQKNTTQGLRTTTPTSILQVSGSQASVSLISALQRPLNQPGRPSSSTNVSTQNSAQQQPNTPGTSTTGTTLSPNSAGTPPPSVSPGLSVAPSLVTLTSQQQHQLQLALQKQHVQLQLPQVRQQQAQQPSQSSNMTSRSKSKKKGSTASSK